MSQNTITIQLSETAVEVHLRDNPRSSRLSLKLHPSDNVFYLTKPPLARAQQVLDFIERSRPWLEKMSAHVHEDVPFAHDSHIPVLGTPHRIDYSYADSPQVTLHDQCLYVKGFDPIVVPGLIKDWLRSHIYRYISDTAQEFAAQIQKQVYSVTIKDTSSRWGSCSRDGNLSFSWRLVFAPEPVARYVCAHEVAHLLEMNHSPAFWQTVEGLYPEYAIHRKWLKQNGKKLFSYG